MDALDDALTSHLDDEPRDIVRALCALARRVAEPMTDVDVPASVNAALAALDAWCQNTALEQEITSATQALDADVAILMSHTPPPPSLGLLAMIECIARKAMYEDDDDWPSDVVITGIEILIELGQTENQAVRAVAQVFAEHDLL